MNEPNIGSSSAVRLHDQAHLPASSSGAMGVHLLLPTLMAGFSSSAEQITLGTPYSHGFFRYVMFRILILWSLLS